MVGIGRYPLQSEQHFTNFNLDLRCVAESRCYFNVQESIAYPPVSNQMGDRQMGVKGSEQVDSEHGPDSTYEDYQNRDGGLQDPYVVSEAFRRSPDLKNQKSEG